MPTVFWFLRLLAIVALLVYAAMAALVWAVHPRQTEFSEPVAIDAAPAPPQPAPPQPAPTELAPAQPASQGAAQ